MAADKVTPISAGAEFRESVGQYADAGWNVGGARFHIAAAGGAAIYLCDVTFGRLLLVTLRKGSLEDLEQRVKTLGLPFDEACNCLGSLFTEIVEGRLALAGGTKNDLAVAAGIYIIGTQGYAIARHRMTLPQFLVIRYPNREIDGQMLRPVPLIKSIPMTPDELVHVTNETLARDRANHPARFGLGQILNFSLTPE